jgi:cysteine-rich repeat protein
VRDARQRALDKVDSACTDAEVMALKFVDRQEALADVTSICRQLERELITAVYGPGLVRQLGRLRRRRGVAGARRVPRGRRRAGDRAAAVRRARAARAVRPHREPADGAGGEIRRRRARRGTRGGRARASRRAPPRAAMPRRSRRSNGHSIEQFLADVGTRADCLVGGVYVQDQLRCPAPQCGNGMEEAGEECDDGNADDTDTCRADCVRTDCPVYANTFDLIQDAIFDSRGCSDDLCHGDANAGGLDLRIGVAYDNIVGVPSMSSDQPRVDPGDAAHSRLWLLTAKATLGRSDVPAAACRSTHPR